MAVKTEINRKSATETEFMPVAGPSSDITAV